MTETRTLGEALIRHRAQHPGCDGCETYLDHCRQAVTIRQRRHQPRMTCWRLSVREAALPDRRNP